VPCIELAWKFVFPSHKLSRDPLSGELRRHHVYEKLFDPRGERASAAGIVKPVSCHTLRRLFHPLADVHQDLVDGVDAHESQAWVFDVQDHIHR
jgi:hypothetical protein